MENNLSKIIHGHWRLDEWKLTSQELLYLTEQCIDLEITSFDHADIYGNYSCEKIFGEALALKKELRKDIQIISKCGIGMLSDKYPNRKVPHYNYSYNNIIDSVENSLKNFGTDYLDVLLLHRPSPFMNPNEIIKVFDSLKSSGKVLNFGLSNFSPHQFEMLQSYTDIKLICNQVEISPLCLEHFENGNVDYFLKERIQALAWSPLAGGRLFHPKTEKEQRVVESIKQVAEELNEESIDKVIYQWIYKHPLGIIPIVGSGKIERIKAAKEAQGLNMSLEQWFHIYTASKGEPLP